MFRSRRLKHLTRKLAHAEGVEKDALWSEALPIISTLIRQGLQRHRPRKDEEDEALAEVLLSLSEGAEGIAGRLAALSPGEIGPYLRVAGGRALIRLRRKGGRRAPRAWPLEVRRGRGQEPEPDEKERALAALATLEPETRFVLRALILGYEMDEIHEALGGGESKSGLYRRRDEGIERLLAAMRDGGSRANGKR